MILCSVLSSSWAVPAMIKKTERFILLFVWRMSWCSSKQVMILKVVLLLLSEYRDTEVGGTRRSPQGTNATRQLSVPCCYPPEGGVAMFLWYHITSPFLLQTFQWKEKKKNTILNIQYTKYAYPVFRNYNIQNNIALCASSTEEVLIRPWFWHTRGGSGPITNPKHILDGQNPRSIIIP